jgi:peptide/nickel transport system substrate-binding protein
MDLQLLGPVEATLDGRPIPLGATKQRALLAMLGLHANATLSMDRLVDGLWGDDPPATAEKMVQLYVSQLRRVLNGAAEIITHGRGYELRIEEERVDAARFERLVREGTADEALALWHGEALADVSQEPFAAAEIRRLEELRSQAGGRAVDEDLAAGRDQEALARLERLIAEEPLREPLHAQRMLALYRAGRQAEALDAYVAARRQLVDEAGVEPGAELHELHARILRQDPALLASRRRPVRPRPAAPRSHVLAARRLVAAAAAAVLLAAAGFAISRLTRADRVPGLRADSVGVIDPKTRAIKGDYVLGPSPGAIAAGAGSVWVANPGDGTVSRIRSSSRRIEVIDAGRAPVALAFGGGSLWVAQGDDGAIARVDPATDRLVQPVAVGNGVRALAVGLGAVWVATALDGKIVRVDLHSGRVNRRTALGGQPSAVAVGYGAVWAAAEESGIVVRIDPRSGLVMTQIGVGHGPSALAAGLGAVWVANRQDGTVSRIDPGAGHVTAIFPAGVTPSALAIADGALWVADSDGAVLRIDPDRGTASRVRTGGAPAALAAAGGRLWVAAPAGSGAHRGGTLRVATGSTFTGPDPAVGGYEPPMGSLMLLAYDGLLTYRRAGGVAGVRLMGGVARDVPPPADGGLRYVFELRKGLRYADGSPVRAADVRASLERMLVLQGANLAPLYDAIEGAAHCRTTPIHCDLSRGVGADERAGTVTIRLRHPDPQLLPNLALPVAAILPAATPRRPLLERPPPGTGPYRIEYFRRDRPLGVRKPRQSGGRMLLVRNPHFLPREGRPAGYADRIELTLARSAQRLLELTASAEKGALDVADLPWTAGWRAVQARSGARIRSGAAPFTLYAWLDVAGPPFDDANVRKALNLAVDRRRAADLTGGPDAGSTTCQVLPPGLPGYRPVCSFTIAPSPAGSWIAPDRERAARMIAASHTRGTRLDLWAWPWQRALAAYLAGLLRDLGYPTRVHVTDDYSTAATERGRGAQLGLYGWFADSPYPAPFLRSVMSCAAFAPGERGSTNLSRFCDPALDAAIDRAEAAGPDAGDAWPRIERRIADAAPIVPLTTQRSAVMTSARAGNVQFHPLAGVLLDQVWVR